MHFRPDEPMHNRYAVDHDFLSPTVGLEAITIAQTVNAFFRWEFNSCEMLVQGDTVLPIDYANACPDVAVTSLHYYFPWAMRTLVKWSAFCVATGRRGPAARRPDAVVRRRRRPGPGLRRQAGGTTRGWPTSTSSSERYDEFCAAALPDIDEIGVRLGVVAGVRPVAGRDHRGHLPGARGRPVPRPLPRPARLVEDRRSPSAPVSYPGFCATAKIRRKGSTVPYGVAG